MEAPYSALKFQYSSFDIVISKHSFVYGFNFLLPSVNKMLLNLYLLENGKN